MFLVILNLIGEEELFEEMHTEHKIGHRDFLKRYYLKLQYVILFWVFD